MIQEPLGYDTKGRPVWAVNDAGRPVCGANRKKGPCQSTARMENGRCRLCGGATPTGEDHPRYRTGEYSQDRLKREALLNRLAFSTAAEAGSDPMLERVVQVLRQNVDEGNFTAAKYVFDQLAGQPRTTLVYEISDKDLLETLAGITAEFIGPDRFEAWWGRVKGALEARA